MNFTEKASDKTRFINRAVNSLDRSVFNLLDFMEKNGKSYNNFSMKFNVSDNFAEAFAIPYYTDFSEYYDVINPSIVAIRYKEIFEGLNFTAKTISKNIIEITINK